MTPPNTTTITSPLVYGEPIPPTMWENIRTEFGLPALDQARARLASIHPDPEPVMRELVRVFLRSCSPRRWSSGLPTTTSQPG